MALILILIHYKSTKIIITFEDRILHSDKFCFEAIHVSVASVFKETLSAAQNNGKDRKPVLIDQVMLHRYVYKTTLPATNMSWPSCY